MSNRKKLFIDDEREIEMIFPDYTPDEWVLVRDGWEAINYLKENEFPIHIAFDYYLGDFGQAIRRSGADVASIISNQVHRGRWTLPEGFTYSVHSSNPEWAQEIRIIMDDLLKEVNMQ